MDAGLQFAQGPGHAAVKTGQALGGGAPTGQARIAVDEPAQRILHLAKSVGNLDHVAKLDGAAEIARRRHKKREDDRRLLEKRRKPDEPLLRLDELKHIAQHLAEAGIQMLARCSLAAIKGHGLAVFAQPHQAVAEIGLAPFLPVVQADQPAADEMGKYAAHDAIGKGHPHHVARHGHHLCAQRHADAAGNRPEDADERHERDRGVEQAHAHAQRAARETSDVFLDALVGVVGHTGRTALPHQLQVVVAVVGQPLVHVVPRHPAAPAQIQPLGDVELVHRQHDGGECQNSKYLHLPPEHRRILFLQRVVERVVPPVELHAHVHRGQVQHKDERQQQARAPFFLRTEIRQRQPPGVAQKTPPAAAEGISEGVGSVCLCHAHYCAARQTRGWPRSYPGLPESRGAACAGV